MLKKIKRILYRSFENKEISYKKLQEMMDKDKYAILLDVRSPQEFNEGHLSGAINIPLYDFKKKLNKLPNKESLIIIYCTSGHRSKQAKEKLEKMGYENVYHLKNGLDGMWTFCPLSHLWKSRIKYVYLITV